MISEKDQCDEVLVTLRRIVRAIDLQSRKLIQNHGITGPQILILKCLIDRPGAAVGELAQRVNLSQATVTDILDRLEKRALVVRSRSTADKRRVLVYPTPAAKRLIKRAPSLLQDAFTTRFLQLEPWERSQMLSTLQRVANMMDADGLDASPVLTPGAFVENDGGGASPASDPN